MLALLAPTRPVATVPGAEGDDLMGWTFHRHELLLDTDSHGGEKQQRSDELHADLLAHLRLEAAAFLAWRDPEQRFIRSASFDGHWLLRETPR